jgi:putative transposase
MVVKPSRRREMAQRSIKEFGASIQLACQAFRISQACYRYQAKHQAENDVIRLHATQWI